MWWIGSTLQRRFQNHPSNALVLDGIRTVLQLASGESVMQLRPWTWWADWQDRRRFSQLNHQSCERFPILKEPLPLQCLFRVGPCPVLVHPDTGVLFGARVGPYLNLLRLPEEARNKTTGSGAVWPRCPLPTMRELELEKLFGPDWVVPNTLHSAISDYYRLSWFSVNWRVGLIELASG